MSVPCNVDNIVATSDNIAISFSFALSLITKWCIAGSPLVVVHWYTVVVVMHHHWSTFLTVQCTLPHQQEPARTTAPSLATELNL